MSAQPLRPYQSSAVAAVRAHWAAGVRSVCLVAPTGAGKTRLGEELADISGPVLWVAHRRELVLQAAERLRARFGRDAVGVIMPGEPENPKARIQVGTVQTLLARKTLPAADLLVLDECHHYAAEEWCQLAEAYGARLTLGLTATPERRDGEPLGDIFDKLVVAASYSELLRDGFLVPVRVFAPPHSLGNDLAQDPVRAWADHSEGSQAFIFCARVETAYQLAERFRGLGVQAQTVEADTSKRDRDDILRRFRSGTVRIVTNVFALTEGVDVPEARTVMLARAFGHVGGFLQAAGRVLRPAVDKPDAIVIDLTGATHRHGMPTDDREYSLSGRAISTREHGGGKPPEFRQEIRGVALRMVAPGALPRGAKPEPVKFSPVDEAERKAEYRRLLGLARQHRMRDGFAAVKYREKYGEEPRREWA